MPSTTLKYSRAGNVCAVVTDMCNRNRHPVLIKSGEDNNDLKGTWSNEVPTLWEFCYRHLSKEGLTSSSKGVEDLLTCVFQWALQLHSEAQGEGRGE